jgi:hypothetical protein
MDDRDDLCFTPFSFSPIRLEESGTLSPLGFSISPMSSPESSPVSIFEGQPDVVRPLPIQGNVIQIDEDDDNIGDEKCDYPTTTLDDSSDDELPDIFPSREKCVICYEASQIGSETINLSKHLSAEIQNPDENQRVRKLCMDQHGFSAERKNACGHYFHAFCLHGWVKSFQDIQNSPKTATCPMCRRPFTRKFLIALCGSEFKTVLERRYNNPIYGERTLRPGYLVNYNEQDMLGDLGLDE